MLSNKQFQILRYLMQLAMEGTMAQRHASCLVKGGKILRVGVNSYTSHAEEKVLRLQCASRQVGTEAICH